MTGEGTSPSPAPPSGLNGSDYLLGFSSLVPFLGVLTGILSIVMGIVKIKRGGWKLVTLGAAGILVTVALTVGAAFWYRGLMKAEAGPVQEARKQMTIGHLTACLQAIEHHRRVHGKYPATLQELKKTNPTLATTDAMVFRGTAATLQDFVYDPSPTGNGYYLFSRGKDGDAFTADDLFPKVSPEESGWIGYQERPSDLASLQRSPIPPARQTMDAEPKSITWLTPSEGEEEARRTGKPTLIDITAEWCGPCRRLNAEVFEDPAHARRIAKAFVTVRALDRRREEGKNPDDVDAVERKYLNRGFPTIVVVRPDGSFDRMVGYSGAGAVMQFFEKNGMK